MSNATIESPPPANTGLKETAAAAWESRPRSRGLRPQFVWAWLVVKLLCRQHFDWLLSAGIHLALLLGIAGFALHHGRGIEAVAIDSAFEHGLAEQAFDNVLGDDSLTMGGGGTPFETSATQAVEMAQQASELSELGEFARGMAGSSSGDGGSGGGTGGGTGIGHGPGIGAGFFGTKGAGKSFVYVVDMSGSMYGDRFARAKSELIKSINKLSAEQKFYVFFFNDRTFPLFEPKPAKGMIPANKSNKERAGRWIGLRRAESTTNPNYALQQALEMKPEVIFLLTDGELDEPEAVRQMIRNHNKSNVVIHTIAFENEEGGLTLESIAKENHGTYRFVK
jgi:hypothetical protein